MSLKSLANKVLERNLNRNFGVGKEGEKLRVLREKPHLQTFDIQAHNRKARSELDRFFTEVIVPELSRLHMAGKLPNLAQDPTWSRVEGEWNQASVHSTQPCDIERVKTLMREAVEAYKRIGEQQGMF